MLRLALRGRARPMLITDAMPPAAGGRATFTLAGHTITARGDACVRPDGTLAGTALTMAAAVRNAVGLLEMPLAAALQAASRTPAAFLGLTDRLGRLAPGYRADLVAFDPDTVGVEPMERVFDLPGGADRLIVHSRGIEHVWVNGTAIRTDGKDVDDARPGVLMRGGTP